MINKFVPVALLALAVAACKPEQAPVAAPAAAPEAPAAAPEATQPGVVQQTVEVPQLQVPTVDGKTYDLAAFVRLADKLSEQPVVAPAAD